MALPLLPELDHTDSLELLHRQTTVLELIASGAALPEMLSAITEALEGLIPGSRCSVLLLCRTRATLTHGAAPSLPAVYSAAIDGMPIGPDAGSCGTAAWRDEEVVAADIDTDPRWVRYRDLARPHGLRACWSSPIRGRREAESDLGVLGTFAVYHPHPHRPSGRERRLVERFTHLASVAIEHSRLYGALQESEERFRRAFEDNAVGMALTGLDGGFLKVNRALREMLGRDEDDLLSSGLAAALSPEADVAVRACAGSGQARANLETTVPGPDGALRASVTGSLVRGADGAPSHLAVNVLDVTARRAAERDRRARREAELARGAAEAASRAKSDFLSALSHELRTPLQAITGFTELLGTLDLPPARRNAALGHISGASKHILALVDDVLDIAAIEAGALPLHVEALELGPAVAEVTALLAPLADERQVTLHPGPVSATVRADHRRLRQVLINLVTNAVRYNRTAGWVRISAERRGPGRVVLRVRDSGPGIGADELQRLFVPFDRLGADTGPEPGAGLGMVLARGLTEAMGGTLAVHSAPGAGTTVEVELAAADS